MLIVFFYNRYLISEIGLQNYIFYTPGWHKLMAVAASGGADTSYSSKKWRTETVEWGQGDDETQIHREKQSQGSRGRGKRSGNIF